MTLRPMAYLGHCNLLLPADYDRAIQIDPDYADAYCNRRLAYQAKGEVVKAVSDLKMCIGLSADPEATKAAQQALREAKKSPSQSWSWTRFKPFTKSIQGQPLGLLTTHLCSCMMYEVE